MDLFAHKEKLYIEKYQVFCCSEDVRIVPHGACVLVVQELEHRLDISGRQAFGGLLQLPPTDSGEAMLWAGIRGAKMSCNEECFTMLGS